MSPEQTEALAAAARQRLAYFVNRKAAQQLRRMREHWARVCQTPTIPTTPTITPTTTTI